MAVQIEVNAEHAPELFTLSPPLADLVGMQHGSRQRVLHALWHYISLNKLQVLAPFSSWTGQPFNRYNLSERPDSFA